MKRLVWEFLNTKYEGIVIYHGTLNLSDKRTENFVTDRGNGVIQFSYSLRREIKNYFDIHDIDIEMYVLEWCRDKSIKTIEI